ncbi:MAG TPA: DNA repair protein RecO [Myxococcaceae bacterium]|nr:DNA repair protein RecO [Myxococcaceae bacterium]
MERWTDEALVLGTLDYADADRLVTLFTRTRGRLTAFAAGARKSRRRFAGALEPCTLLRAQLVARRGSTLRLDGVDVVRAFHRLRDDLPRLGRALYAVELCRELVREEEPHPELFDAARTWLAELEEGAAGPTSLLAFELRALALAGLMPRFDACCLCGGEPGPEPRFDPGHGGTVCLRCQGRAPGAARVPPEHLLALSALQAGARTPLPPAVRAAARGLLNAFIAHQLGRPLKGVEFLRQLGVD